MQLDKETYGSSKLYRVYLRDVSESYIDIVARDQKEAQDIAQELLDYGLEQVGFEVGNPPERTITDVVGGDWSTYASSPAPQTDGLQDLVELKRGNVGA